MKLTRDRELKKLRRKAQQPDPERDRLLAIAAAAFGREAFAESEGAARQVLARYPDHPDALHWLGGIALRFGHTADAVRHFEAAVRSAPASPILRQNLSLGYRLTRRLDDAVRQGKEATRLAPRDAEARLCLAAALMESYRFEEAHNELLVVLELDPNNPDAHGNVAKVLKLLGRNEEADSYFETLASQQSSSPESWLSLGWARSEQRRYDEAVECLRRSTMLRRASRWWPRNGVSPVPADPSVLVNALKLDHDIEQFRYLGEKGLLPAELSSLASHYEAIREQLTRTHGAAASTTLVRGSSAMFDATYRRMIHWRDTSALPETALGSSLDCRRIEAAYAEPPGICWVDGLLSERALAEVRAFCLESTIWNDVGHDFRIHSIARGYLGSYGADGLCCPLLFQIADELTRALPAIFQDHRLIQMWTYKYESTLDGIAVHGDDAAVNVNFWITPDDANLDPGSGGLVIHPVEAPADWKFNEINGEVPRIQRFLSESGAAPVNVPYRQNRAVIFNSDLFHATAPLHFKPGYENRRINVTMLFGRRGG